MTLTLTERETLNELLDGLCDDRLTDADHEQLAALLTDDEAVDIYVAHMNMHAGLAWDFSVTSSGETGQEHEPDTDAALSNEPRIPLSGLGCEPSSPTSCAAPVFSNTIGYFASGWPVAYLVATVICGLGLLIGTLTPLSHSTITVQRSPSSPTDRPPDRLPIEFVGQVTGLVDCQWADLNTATHDRAHIPVGRTYALASGLMEITYQTGAKVILEGPCTYVVDSPVGGYLSVGKLTARIAKKEERRTKNEEQLGSNSSFLVPHSYFSIRTPTATVTDLGTEFGVAVADDGETTSHVFRGSVEVQVVAGKGDAQSGGRVLRENESIRVVKTSDNRLTLVESRQEPANFVREVPKTAAKLFDLVDAVAGGNGFSGKRHAGIDQTNGQPTRKTPANPDSLPTGDGQYHRVIGLPFVDGVFIPSSRYRPMQVDSAGHTFADWTNADGGTSSVIWAGGAGDGSKDFRQTTLGGVDYATGKHGFLFMHANKGITFDLDAVRQANPGYRVTRFRSVAGNVEPGSEQGEPVNAENAHSDPRCTLIDVLPEVRSELALPLRAGGQMLGVLDLQSSQLSAFSAGDVAVMQTLANQIAVAMYNTRLFTAEAEAHLASHTLREVGQLINSTLDSQEVLERILSALGKVLHYDSGSIMLLEGSDLVIKAVHGFTNPQDVLGVHMPIKKFPLNHQIVTQALPIVLDDVGADNRWQKNRRLPVSGEVHAWMGVPLVSSGKVLGMLAIDNYKPGAYTTNDIPLVTAFANQAAIALDNARLYAQLHQRAQQLATLNELARIVSGELDRRRILVTLCEQMRQVIPLDSFHGSLYDAETNTLQIAVRYDLGEYRDSTVGPLEQFPWSLKIIQSRQPILYLRTAEEMVAEAEHRRMVGDKTHLSASLMFAPLIVGDDILAFCSSYGGHCKRLVFNDPAVRNCIHVVAVPSGKTLAIEQNFPISILFLIRQGIGGCTFIQFCIKR